MRIGISPRDSKLAIVAKLCVLVPLAPLWVLVGVFVVGIPETWRAIWHLPEEIRTIGSWYREASP